MLCKFMQHDFPKILLDFTLGYENIVHFINIFTFICKKNDI